MKTTKNRAPKDKDFSFTAKFSKTKNLNVKIEK